MACLVACDVHSTYVDSSLVGPIFASKYIMTGLRPRLHVLISRRRHHGDNGDKTHVIKNYAIIRRTSFPPYPCHSIPMTSPPIGD